MILWNSNETSPELTDNEDTIIDNHYFGAQNVAVNLAEQGALDPARQQKYGVTNWTELTIDQLAQEISNFSSVMSVNYDVDGGASDVVVENRGKNLLSVSPFTKSLTADTYVDLETIQLKSGTDYVLSTDLDNATFRVLNAITDAEITLSSDSFTAPNEPVNIQIKTTITGDYTFNAQLEEGSEATDYEPPRTDLITISNTELHGYSGVFNQVDKAGSYTKYWERATTTTDGSNNLDMSGYSYLSGSKVIIRNTDNGEVAVKDAVDTVATDWASANVEILYRLNSPVRTTITKTGEMLLYPGHNNIVSNGNTGIVEIEYRPKFI